MSIAVAYHNFQLIFERANFAILGNDLAGLLTVTVLTGKLVFIHFTLSRRKAYTVGPLILMQI